MRTTDERGSTLPLLLVFFAIAVGFVAVGTGATALHLERMRLLSIADGAALAGAESFAVDDVVLAGGSVEPRLRPDEVGTAVQRHLALVDTVGLDGFRLERAGTDDGLAATVSVSAVWHPPLVSGVLPVAVPVTVTSVAAARFR